MKYTKSPYSQYLKKLKALYPDNSSPRWTYGVVNDRLTHREFKMVLPFIPKQHVAMKGSQEKPTFQCLESMNVMINCLKRSDYNESVCESEINAFNECYKNFLVATKEANERRKSGIYDINPNQSRFPVKFMQKMLNQYKTPRKVDDGPDIPVFKCKKPN